MLDFSEHTASEILDSLYQEKTAAPAIVMKAWKPIKKTLAAGINKFDNSNVGKVLEANPQIFKATLSGAIGGAAAGGASGGSEGYAEAKKKGENKLKGTLHGIGHGILPGAASGALLGFGNEMISNKKSRAAVGSLFKKKASEELDELLQEKQAAFSFGAVKQSFKNISGLLRGKGAGVSSPVNPIQNVQPPAPAPVPAPAAATKASRKKVAPSAAQPAAATQPAAQPAAATPPAAEPAAAKTPKAKPFLSRGQVAMGIGGLGVGAGLGLANGALQQNNQDRQRTASEQLDELLLEKQATVGEDPSALREEIAKIIAEPPLSETAKLDQVAEAKGEIRSASDGTRSVLPHGLVAGVKKLQRKTAADLSEEFGLVEKQATSHVIMASGTFLDNLSLVDEYGELEKQAEAELTKVLGNTMVTDKKGGMKVPTEPEAKKESEVSINDMVEDKEVEDEAKEDSDFDPADKYKPARE